MVSLIFLNEDIKENQPTNKKKTYSEEEKKAYSLKMKKLKEEAKLYEEFVCNYYIDKDYEVIHHGRKGKKDKGIDVIAKKENEIILIQTKNYAKTTKIKQDSIRKFNGDCLNYAMNEKIEIDSLKFLYIIPNKESFDVGAIKYFQ